MTTFILDPAVSFRHVDETSKGIDVGIWTLGNDSLVVATNIKYQSQTLDLASLGLGNVKGVSNVLDSGVSLSGTTVVTFSEVGSGAFVVQH